MNKLTQTIVIGILLAALVFFVTIFGILMLIIASAVSIFIALLVEYARNKKKKEG